jgi:hypothetical protein
MSQPPDPHQPDQPAPPPPGWPRPQPGYQMPPPPGDPVAVRHRNSITMIIFGAVGAVAGIWGLISVSRAYGICNSGLGAFVQASSSAARQHCSEDSIVHWGAVLVLVAGVLLALAGVIRLAIERRP